MSKKKEDSDIKKWAGVATVVILILWAITFTIPYDKDSFFGDRGTFGDMFGAVNALFSGFAFAGIIITIILQSRELKLQREELSDTREVFEEQSRLMATQQNDNTFFNLLDNHRKLIESFKSTYNKDGYELLERTTEEWKNVFSLYSESYNAKRILDLDLYKHVGFDSFINSYPDMHTFYREVLHIHKFIETKLSSNKDFYKESLRNSLTNKEHFIFESIYHNFPSERNGIKFDTIFYNHYQYVDFNSCFLPKIQAYVNENKFRKQLLFIETDSELLKMELIINHRDSIDRYRVELFEILNIDINQLVKNKTYKFDIENYLCNSKLNIGSFPIKDNFRFPEFEFLVKSVLIKDSKCFDFVFKLDIRTREKIFNNEEKRYAMDRIEIKPISPNKYNSIKSLDFNSKCIPLKIDILKKINPINNVLKWYFNENPDETTVLAKDMMKRFISDGIFEKDSRNELPIEQILIELDEIGRLDLIKTASPKKKSKNTNWYFKKLKTESLL